MAKERRDATKEVLDNLYGYLQENLPVDRDLIAKLRGKNLLDKNGADRLRAAESKGGTDGVCELLNYMSSYYDEKMLETFCVFLEEYSQPAKPVLFTIATRIREEMKRHQLQPHPTQPAEIQEDVPGPSGTGPLRMESSTRHPSGTTWDDVPGPSGPQSSPPATVEEPTPTVSTRDERSQKIKKIVDMYRSESTEVSLLEIPELEDDFDDIMGSLNAELSSADPKVISKLKGMLGVKYRRYIHGVKPVEPPSIPNTPDGLYHFIAKKSTTYEILLIHHAVDQLNCEDLRRTLQNYESKLAGHLRLTLKLYKEKNVILQLREHHAHIAIVLSKDQVLLSLVLHIKDYLMKYLQLEEALFEGFWEGSTVLFFSILQVDAVLLGPKVLSHAAELKRMFDMTHLVVFDYFACDLEKATIELPEKHECKMRELEASLEEAKQLKDQMMEERVKLREAQDDAEMFKKSTVELGKRNNLLEEKLHQLLVEKKEMDLLLSSLQTKQKELEGDESLLERNKLEAALKEEVATLKATLEEKNKELETTRQKLSDAENRLEGAVKVSKEKHEHKMKELGASPEESEQVSTMMKERVKLRKAKEAEMIEKSTVQLGEQKDELEEKLSQSLVEKKKEMDSLLSSLQTKQKELEGDESLLEKDKLEAALKEEIATLKATLEEMDELFEEEKLKLSHLYWRREPDVLEGMWWPTAVYLNKKIFVGDRRFGYRQFLCIFDVVSRTWSKLPFHDSCEMSGFTLATSNSKVHTLGGTWSKDEKVEEYSNKVFSLDDDLKWFNTLPPLNIGRIEATSTSFDSFILVAGGYGRNGDLSSVEVLDSSQSSSTWWEICDLPVKSWLMQCAVTYDELFIGCGGGTANTVYTAKLSAVKESLNVDEDSESSVSPEFFWQSLPHTPLWGSGLVSVNNCLLTVGGHDDGLKPHSSVHLYDHYEKTWSKVSDSRKSRWRPAVVVSTFENKQELSVLGGGRGAVTSVESCELL